MDCECLQLLISVSSRLEVACTGGLLASCKVACKLQGAACKLQGAACKLQGAALQVAGAVYKLQGAAACKFIDYRFATVEIE